MSLFLQGLTFIERFLKLSSVSSLQVCLCFQCRYTLQYTYPYAYYMESGPRKKLVRNKLLPLSALYRRTNVISYGCNCFQTDVVSLILCFSMEGKLIYLAWFFFSLCYLSSTVWVPAGSAGSRDRKPVVEGGASRHLRERSGGRRGRAQRQWQRGMRR